MKKIFLYALTLLFATVVFLQASDSFYEVNGSQSITIAREIYNSETGKFEYISDDFKVNLGTDYTELRAFDEDGEMSPLRGTWSSSDEDVIFVDEYGVLDIQNVGEAIITFTLYEGISDSIKITVGYPKEITVMHGDSSDNCEAIIGNYTYLNAVDENGEVISHYITWSSSNEEVATVTKSGTVEGKSVGDAIITATTSNGLSDSIKISVREPAEITEITIMREVYNDITQDYEYVSDDFELSLEDWEYLDVLDKDKTRIKTDNIIWTSSDENIVTVYGEGRYAEIYAKNYGTAVITATLENGVSDTIKITVPFSGIPVERVTLNKIVLDIPVDTEETLTATVEPDDATEKSVTWSTDNESVATVDSNGVVKGIRAGTATITATAKDGSGKKATCIVTVKSIPVTKIAVSPATLTLNVGYTSTLEATVSPSSASDKTVTWTSSNKSIATVDRKGVVKGIKAGTVTITATANDGSGKKASCKVTVKPIPVTKIVVSPATLTLKVGYTSTLEATVSPSDATDKTVTWTTSNKSIATVDSKGVVIGIKAGTVTITATANDGSGKKATCKVTVKPIPVTKIVVSPATLTLNVGKTSTLDITASPIDATDKTVTWKTSNKAIATVDSKGVVKGIKAGTVTITATANDGSGKKATCKVTVKQPVTKIAVSPTSLTLNIGKTKALKTTVSPSNATDKTVTWKSSNAKIATVDSNGVVKGISVGTVTITATAKDGSGKKATCKVIVILPVTKIVVSPAALTLNVGKSIILLAKVSPNNATDKTVTWKSSNAEIATVDSKGIVKGIKAGTVTITATAKDGSGKKGTCKVTVKQPVVKVTGVKLNKTSSSLSKGKTVTLTATVTPSNATDKTVTWKSSNTNVATVDKNGKVKGIKAGTATITVTTKDGKKTATCKITVK